MTTRRSFIKLLLVLFVSLLIPVKVLANLFKTTKMKKIHVEIFTLPGRGIIDLDVSSESTYRDIILESHLLDSGFFRAGIIHINGNRVFRNEQDRIDKDNLLTYNHPCLDSKAKDGDVIYLTRQVYAD